jgi:hypothetical protein
VLRIGLSGPISGGRVAIFLSISRSRMVLMPSQYFRSEGVRSVEFYLDALLLFYKLTDGTRSTSIHSFQRYFLFLYTLTLVLIVVQCVF